MDASASSIAADGPAPLFGPFEQRTAGVALLMFLGPFALALWLQARERRALRHRLSQDTKGGGQPPTLLQPDASPSSSSPSSSSPSSTPMSPQLRALQERQTRALAWVVTLVASVVETAAGVYAVATVLLPSGYDHAMLYVDRPWCRALLVFFFTSLLLDLVLGLAFYRSHLHPLTGWVHHVVYMLFVATLLRTRASLALTCVMIEELPTALLGAGQIFPALRHDLAFGVSFFLTRLLYHGWYLANIVFVSMRATPLHPAVLTSVAAAALALGLHLMWFLQWCKNMRKYFAIAREKKTRVPVYDLTDKLKAN